MFQAAAVGRRVDRSADTAAEVLGVSAMTISRRLKRGRQLLAATLRDLSPGEAEPDDS